MYEHIIYIDHSFRTIAEVEPRLHNRTLTMNGLSKAYSMTGWRLGYAAGPVKLIEAMEKAQVQQTSGASVISQWAATEALTGTQAIIAERRAEFRRRRDLVVGLLRDIPLLDCASPEGAFYAFPACGKAIGCRAASGKTITNDYDFALELLSAEGVAVVPGMAFGVGSHFRVSFAGADDQLTEGCSRIRSFCSSLS
jgi:aspartate aminotransferase